VLLVDLDLRRPFLDRFFDLEDAPGLTDAILGHVSLEQAIARIAFGAARQGASDENGNGPATVSGVLEVVPSGPVPPDPGEIVASHAFALQLDVLKRRADLLILDSPPLLHIGDALTLSGLADGMIVVTRLEMFRRPLLAELRRALDSTRAHKLGFVLTGSDIEADYAAYGYARSYRQPAPKSRRERVS
jgi:non-specific protein-tyrosine kinase